MVGSMQEQSTRPVPARNWSQGRALLATAWAALALAGCGGGSGSSGAGGGSPSPGVTAKPLVHVSVESAGAQCPKGGSRIESGLDRNSDGVLQGEEIMQTQFVCQDVQGPAAKLLLSTQAESAGAACPQGGMRVRAGQDANGNQKLDDSEVVITSYVCTEQLAPGTRYSLMSMEAEPAGLHCAAGGTRLSAGEDRNANGRLDADEVAFTRYACDTPPSAGSAASLVDIAVEPPGAVCPAGGSKVMTGLDANRNGVLDAQEVSKLHTLCNGTEGGKALSTRLVQTPVPAGAQCPAGGVRMDTGLDLNGNGVLDGSEVQSTAYVCSGASGNAGAGGQEGIGSLMAMEDVATAPGCTGAAVRITAGPDSNRNHLLDAAEVTSTRYLCQGARGNDGATGANGQDGQDGRNSLVRIDAEAAGANCPAGGNRVSSGLDLNRDSSLSGAEVSSVQYLCHGANGSNGLSARVLMSGEPAGAHCAAGGQRISVGLDADGDGALSAGEVQSTSYVCNGARGDDGLNSLSKVEAIGAGAACPQGGSQISSGLDSNRNGLLDAAEVSSIGYACHGATGATGATGPAGPAGPGAAVFTTAGSYVVPAGVHAVLIEGWGGGGAGGNAFNCRTTACAQVSTLAWGAGDAAGGGSGAYQRIYLAVSPGDTLAVSAGAGGVAASPGILNATTSPPPASGRGGDSKVVYQGTTVLLATGGAAGTHHLYSSDDGSEVFGVPGIGGSASFAAPALGLSWTQGQAASGTQGGGIPGTPGAGGNGFRLASETLATHGATGMLIILPLN